jgi:hypothetical protein
VNLTTVAAFAAAGLALIGVILNVFWGARLTGHAQVDQWRRNEERPIVARILELSQDASTQWQLAWMARQRIKQLAAIPDLTAQQAVDNAKARDDARDRAEAASELYKKLRFETAQLDLIAGRLVRDVAHELFRVHLSWCTSLGAPFLELELIRADNGSSESPGLPDLGLPDLAHCSIEEFAEQQVKLSVLHVELVDKARADLGLTTGERQSDRAERRWVDLMTPIARV